MAPPATHSPIIHVADDTFIATRLGNWKMPAPITMPTTIEAAEATERHRLGWPAPGGWYGRVGVGAVAGVGAVSMASMRKLEARGAIVQGADLRSGGI